MNYGYAYINKNKWLTKQLFYSSTLPRWLVREAENHKKSFGFSWIWTGKLQLAVACALPSNWQIPALSSWSLHTDTRMSKIKLLVSWSSNPWVSTVHGHQNKECRLKSSDYFLLYLKLTIYLLICGFRCTQSNWMLIKEEDDFFCIITYFVLVQQKS